TAQDRLWQIDRLRRRALGEQAEVLGPAYVASDIAHLTVGIDQIAAREVAATDPAIGALLEAYVAGINRTIDVLGLDLPPEFRHLGYQPAPFTVRDVIAIGRGIWWSLNGRIDRLAAAEAARFLPTEPLRTLYLTPEAPENLVCPSETLDRCLSAGTDDCTGSNNWALRPERTGTGHAILCGDPHQPFWVPSSWYEYALHGPEDDAAGAGHPGFPGTWWGYNGRIAWAITNNMASTRDLYREEVHPSDPSLYRENGGWQRFGERTVTIRVKGEADRTVTIRSTTRGPIVNDLVTPMAEGGDPPLSLRWVGAEHLDDVRASINISRAQDWGGFRDVLKDWAVAVFNFVYADSAGNVGYQMAGRLPVRGRITHGFRDAANEEDSWRGYIPFDGLPRQYNPARGYVASANQRIVAPDYPHPIYGAYSQGHRGVRLDQVFEVPGPHDHLANIRVQNDVKNCRAERWAPHIVRHLAGSSDPDARLLAGALAGWDYEYTLASAAPTLFESFMALWTRHVLAMHLPARLLDLTVQQTNLGAAVLAGEGPSSVRAQMAGSSPAMTGLANYFPDGTMVHVAAVAREAVAALRDRLGPDPSGWTWGRVHVAHWHHPLGVPEWDVGPAPMTGGSHTLRNSGGELPPHSASSGAEYRMVVDFAQPDRFLAVQNIGNSGVPGSPHYRDQFQAWIDGTYHTVHLRPEGVDSDTVSITRITPG
ncbi:MAG: penicillin acylase family protein, partial [Acetobacteraceae bacterium]|nr:penicillin acylase family protein [Acetobacteraceae bacterium]